MTEKEKMLAGKIYDASDDELKKLRENAHRLSREYNLLDETDGTTRAKNYRHGERLSSSSTVFKHGNQFSKH